MGGKIKPVGVCKLLLYIHLSLFRLNIIQRSFEYAWGNFSSSQSNKIKITQLQSHLKLVCAQYTTADLKQSCMPKKLKFNSLWCENSNHNSGYCDSFKVCLNVSFNRISIGNLNRNVYRARNNFSNFVIMH